jgi:2-haloacid dehalogenase
MTFRPKYITFDCYGTLTYFRMHEVACDIYTGQLPLLAQRSALRSR